MPDVYYPFGADHRHAGKFYKGWMPEGNVRLMLRASGARLCVASQDPELADYGPPKAALIVTEEELIREEIAAAVEMWDLLKADIEAAGRTAMAAQYARQFDGILGTAGRQFDDKDINGARLSLGKLEEVVAKAQSVLLGGSTTIVRGGLQYAAQPAVQDAGGENGNG